MSSFFIIKNLLSAVSMNIQEKMYISFIAEDLLFKIINLWMVTPAWLLPLPINIIA